MNSPISEKSDYVPQTANILLEARGVSAFYGSTQILRGVSFSVARGSLTALLGANGSGKSTLLRLLAGLQTQQLKAEGSILVNGVDINILPRKAAARFVAYTAQNETSAWRYTVREAVLMGRYAHTQWNYSKEDDAVAAQKIALMELEKLASRPVTELSGGEFQRTVIARALAQEASLLLLDEPVSSLDIRHQHQLMRMTRSIVDVQNIGAVISLHDINLAALFADRILLLRDGVLVAQGSPEDVLQSDILQQVYGIRFGLYRHPHKNLPQVFIDDYY